MSLFNYLIDKIDWTWQPPAEEDGGGDEPSNKPPIRGLGQSQDRLFRWRRYESTQAQQFFPFFFPYYGV